jgi:ABC-type branched-subunit amino acid transport system permease subunit
MMGRFGLVSLGHDGFMRVGAYVTATQAGEKSAALADRIHRGSRQNPHIPDLILVESRWKLPVPEDNGRLVVIVTHLGIAGG